MDRFQEDGLGDRLLLRWTAWPARRAHSGTNRTPAEQEDVLVVEWSDTEPQMENSIQHLFR